MKTALWIFLIVVLGVGGTAAYSIYSICQFGSPTGQVVSSTTPTTRTAPAADESIEPDQKPVAVVDEPKHDFVRAKNKTYGLKHAFVVRNTGNAPLSITKAEPSCTLCMFIDTSLPTEIPPGGAGEIAIHWNIDTVDDTFLRSVTIHTNDLEHPEIVLVITGKVLQPLRVTPRELVLSHVPMGEPCVVKVRLDAFFSDDLQLSRLELLNAETAEFFDVQTVQVEGADLAPSAQSGLDLVVTVKPGLPLGAFRQRIRLTTNIEENAELTIPIEGMIQGDVSIIGEGKRWDEKRGFLRMGAIKRSQGAKATLKLYVRGSHQEGLVLGTPKVFPDWLVVNCSEPTRIEGGNVTQAKVTIKVPPGSPTADHSGAEDTKPGEIIIPTNRPALGEIKLQINFAVVED
ncbi:MAG TPA: DUF1573 domain-containing protein [Pirellulales bacterium]|nr:DUF1573 domain-containing protein [Pirellulales bacterium]